MKKLHCVVLLLSMPCMYAMDLEMVTIKPKRRFDVRDPQQKNYAKIDGLAKVVKNKQIKEKLYCPVEQMEIPLKNFIPGAVIITFYIGLLMYKALALGMPIDCVPGYNYQLGHRCYLWDQVRFGR